MKVYEGKLDGKGLKISIVVSKFNKFITDSLLGGAVELLRQVNVKDEDINVYYVPGAFEIPTVVKKLIEKGDSDAIICLGAIIRGATPHFEYVAGQVSRAIMDLSRNDKGIPVIYGIVTADSIEQAIERAGTKLGNRGRDAAITAVEMATLMKQL